jgi:hypothetical protein
MVGGALLSSALGAGFACMLVPVARIIRKKSDESQPS